MKKWALTLVLPLLAWVSLLQAANGDITSYGVYIKDGDGYIRLKGFDSWDIYFHHLKVVAVVNNETSQPELLIYYPNIDITGIEVSVHPYIVLARTTRIHPVIEPIKDNPDMYKVTFEESVDSASLLDVTVYDANFRGVVGLSDPVTKLIDIYTNGEHTASSAVYDLDELIKVYPEVKQFKTLRAKWQAKAKIDEDHRDYEEVTKTYAKYERSSSLGAKVEYLRQTLKQIQAYKAKHPNGQHIAEANKLETIVKKKLNI
jgi:hypothetical protein